MLTNLVLSARSGGVSSARTRNTISSCQPLKKRRSLEADRPAGRAIPTDNFSPTANHASATIGGPSRGCRSRPPPRGVGVMGNAPITGRCLQKASAEDLLIRPPSTSDSSSPPMRHAFQRCDGRSRDRWAHPTSFIREDPRLSFRSLAQERPSSPLGQTIRAPRRGASSHARMPAAVKRDRRSEAFLLRSGS